MSNKPQRTKKDQRQAAAAKVAEMRRQQAAAERKRRILLGSVIAVVVLIIVGGAVYLQSTRDPATTSGSSATPTGLTAEGGILRGQDAAPAKLVVYEDFMCPICGEFEQLSKSVLDLDVSKGTLQVEYRPISFLDRESNGTEYSTRAANAVSQSPSRSARVATVAPPYRRTTSARQCGPGSHRLQLGRSPDPLR